MRVTTRLASWRWITSARISRSRPPSSTHNGRVPKPRQPAAQHRLSSVRAVALDTNAFQRGQLDLGALERLVRRAAAHGGVEVWVPEVAVWEWASHASAERQAALSALEAVRPTGLDVPPLALMSKQDVLAELRSAIVGLGPIVRLLPAADVASDAIRDQILVEGPAKTIGARDGRSVKTGAADSALLRSVLAAASGNTDAFVLVSSDKDVRVAFDEWAITPPALFRNVSDASKAVFDAVPSSAVIEASCLTLLVASVDAQSLGRLGGDVAAHLYDDDTSELANEESYADEGRQVVGLSDVVVDREVGAAFGIAHVLAAVIAAGVVQDPTGDSTVMRWSQAIGASVRIPVTFDLDRDAPTAAAVETGQGVAALPRSDDYTAAEDAFEALLDCLRTLPGASSLEWNEPGERGQESTTIDVAGVGRVRLNFDGDIYEEWTVTAAVEASDVGSVGCQCLHDGFSDREGFELPTHYGVWTDIAVGFSRENPVWAINAAVLPAPVVDWHTIQDPHA